MSRWMWLVPLSLWVIAAVFGWLAWFLIVDGRLAVESPTWPSVPGTILSSEAGTTGGYRMPVRFGVAIRYRYTVGGRDFEGHRTSFDPSFSRESAETMAKSHPPGSQTTVYYRPADPDQSVLQPGGSLNTGWGIFMVGLGLLVAVFAAGTTWFARQFSPARLRKSFEKQSMQIRIRLP